MKEQEVDPVPGAADSKPPLPADEREVATKLEEEGLQLGDERRFEVALGVLVVQVQEFEEERILDLLFGRNHVVGRSLLSLAQHRDLEGDGATGDGAITADADGGMYVAVRPLPTVPARYRASIGARIELHDDRHVVCTATIGAAVAVRYGTISGDPGVALRTAKTPLPAAPMWAEDKEGVHIFGSYLAAPLVDASGDCSTALFATAVGRTFTLTRVAAAKEWEAAAPDVFMNAREPGLASEKNALEGGDTPIRFTSVRRLGPAEGPSYALLYGVAETRVIIVERVPGPDLAAGRELASVYAQSPSSVTGVDADGDGAMDVVIGHPGGVSLVKSTGEFLTLSGGVLETEHD